MLLDLYRACMGYVRVEVSGPQPEQFINLAVEADMDLWNLAYGPDALQVNLPLREIFRLRPLVRRSGCRLRIRERGGLPFFRHRLARRRAWLVGAGLSLALLLWISQHIWFVQVRGTQFVDPRAVAYAARQLGLSPGVWRWRLQPSALERRLPFVVPEVVWATVRLNGTRAVVEVVERQTVRPPHLPALRLDVVATKECIVEEIIPYRGRARVKPGQVVRPGQVLIEGVVWVHSSPPLVLPGQPRPEPDRPIRVTAASGQVLGRCFYSHYVEKPLVRETAEPTGRKLRRAVLRWRGREILRAGTAGIPFTDYREQQRTWQVPGWRNWLVPVELQITTVAEVRVDRTPVRISAAEQQAVRTALDRIRWHLNPATDRVLLSSATLVHQNGRVAGFRVRVETVEEIGRAVPVASGLPDPAGSSPERSGREG